ncbi:hypothetical protein WGM54_14080 [Paenibacillus polymyxa]|uniref:hypothetical protein n=1 Tax=Paenibacillus polymyxa TaxID=1406 RepID=UPI00307D8F5A
MIETISKILATVGAALTTTILVMNFFPDKARKNADTEKVKAETEKVKEETRRLKLENDKLERENQA